MTGRKSRRADDPSVTQALKALAGSIGKVLGTATELSTDVPGLTLYRSTAPTAPNPCTYEPSLLLIPQGKKRVDLGKGSYIFGEATFLLTSIELPIVSRVSVASVETPYLAFFLKLDMSVVRDILHTEEVRISAPPVGTRGMVLGDATVELLAPCLRMVQLLDTPQDVPFFGKLLQREIVYRLLQGPQGDRLRSIATLADQSYRTAKAVTWLRDNFEKTLNVDELASMAGMSRSTLHHHFRGLTAMSPIQFQKQLRLHTARQNSQRNLMLRVQRLKWDTKAQASSIGSTSASLESPRCAMYRHYGRPWYREITKMLRRATLKGLLIPARGGHRILPYPRVVAQRLPNFDSSTETLGYQ
jgi:AraC-like DNA-binding protein